MSEEIFTTIDTKYFVELYKLLDIESSKYGNIPKNRRPYKKKDDENGGSGSKLLLDHPLFMEQPIGASSDLSFDTTNNQYSDEKLEERKDEAKLELKQKLELGNQLTHSKKYDMSLPNPTPFNS